MKSFSALIALAVLALSPVINAGDLGIGNITFHMCRDDNLGNWFKANAVPGKCCYLQNQFGNCISSIRTPDKYTACMFSIDRHCDGAEYLMSGERLTIPYMFNDKFNSFRCQHI